jgi:hypothetical protein
VLHPSPPFRDIDPRHLGAKIMKGNNKKGGKLKKEGKGKTKGKMKFKEKIIAKIAKKGQKGP